MEKGLPMALTAPFVGALECPPAGAFGGLHQPLCVNARDMATIKWGLNDPGSQQSEQKKKKKERKKE